MGLGPDPAAAALCPMLAGHLADPQKPQGIGPYPQQLGRGSCWAVVLTS